MQINYSTLCPMNCGDMIFHLHGQICEKPMLLRYKILRFTCLIIDHRYIIHRCTIHMLGSYNPHKFLMFDYATSLSIPDLVRF